MNLKKEKIFYIGYWVCLIFGVAICLFFSMFNRFTLQGFLSYLALFISGLIFYITFSVFVENFILIESYSLLSLEQLKSVMDEINKEYYYIKLYFLLAYVIIISNIYFIPIISKADFTAFIASGLVVLICEILYLVFIRFHSAIKEEL